MMADDRAAAVERVRKFLTEWKQMQGNDPERIYGLHTGVPEREAVLLASDLESICRQFPRPPTPPVYGPPSTRFVPCTDPACETCHGNGEYPTGSGYTRGWVPCGTVEPIGVRYVNPIIGYWDQLGYTHCIDCADIPTPIPDLSQPSLTPIDSGNSAVLGSICGWCGADVGALYDPSNRMRVERQ